MSQSAKRLAIAGMCTVGMLEALYMLAYEEELIDSLYCPFFGEGCNIVGRSEHARHFGVPNAAVGAVAYAGMATLALWMGRDNATKRPLRALGLAAIAGAAAGASAVLTWKQHSKVKAYCFWCLSSAAINAALLPLTLPDARRAWGALTGQR
jgi:uncharacterized membrane protein